MSTTCSARLVQPFLRFVHARRIDPDLVPREFWSANADGRISLEAALDMLEGGVEHLRDERLGLKLGRTMRFGEGGAFDYAVRSAPTVRDAVDVAARYARLHTDSFSISFERWRNQAVVRVVDEASTWTDAAADFAMSAFYGIHVRDLVPTGAKLECWFPYTMPADTSGYDRAFAGATLKFEAPFFGFAFDQAYEEAPILTADAVLHAAHCARVDSLLGELSAALALKVRVHRLIEREIRYLRSATLPSIAGLLRMSRRTLTRRLEEEGTSFVEELDNVRRELALSTMIDGEAPLKEVAFRLGFSHAESFHRAFKRWTGETPLAYRKRTRA